MLNKIHLAAIIGPFFQCLCDALYNMCTSCDTTLCAIREIKDVARFKVSLCADDLGSVHPSVLEISTRANAITSGSVTPEILRNRKHRLLPVITAEPTKVNVQI